MSTENKQPEAPTPAVQEKPDRFFMPKKLEYLKNRGTSNPFANPDQWHQVIIPHDLVDQLIELGRDICTFLGGTPGPDFDKNAREHQLQLFFVICYNVPGTEKVPWIKILNKLYDLGKFAVRNPEELENAMKKAELCGQYITPAVIEWLDCWLDQSIKDEVLEQHLLHRKQNAGVNCSFPFYNK